MLTTLQTTYTDTRAGDLAWCLGKDPLPALAVLGVEVTDGQRLRAQVELRLLGASHQVLVDAGGGRGCSETVACLPGSQAPLPFGVSRRLGTWDYEFAARIETLNRRAFAGRAQELLALVADHPNGLAGTFPGDPNAFTALLVQCDEGGVRWRTWHAYPQEGRLVSTRTRLAVGSIARAAPSAPPGCASRPGHAVARADRAVSTGRADRPASGGRPDRQAPTGRPERAAPSSRPERPAPPARAGRTERAPEPENAPSRAGAHERTPVRPSPSIPLL